ncbi:DUF2254 domain-containing protein [Sulfitobacter noctilucae]|uniref:DUF2254 domain-containing protein n=1 Tax=Sulfitobacter noctilucae TaxID=1342302 RepID=UPI001F4CFDB6|nr:DUF2254 domain-containing protein [Sulfitobacter noctilucae]
MSNMKKRASALKDKLGDKQSDHSYLSRFGERFEDVWPAHLMPQTVLRRLGEYSRKLWVRVLIMGFLSVAALGLTQVLEPLVPDELARTLTGDGADRLLQIIANAMLAATIFSITVMVSVFRASSQQWTPRVHRLIIQDKTTQNTIAVFIGAYVYALIAIILRELGVYTDERSFVLFITTVLVLAVIVIYLIRWVFHLQGFGSLINTTRQIEQVTSENFQERLQNPCLGANPLIDGFPKNARKVLAKESGYIQKIYPETLNSEARAQGVDVYMCETIGNFIFLNEPLAMVVPHGDANPDGQEYDEIDDAISANVVIGDVRTFDQDPRFGLIVMGEVASKALSPGINDPGTAIDVITRVGRILSDYKDETATDRDEVLDRLYVTPLSASDLLDDGFAALARDGETVVEVQVRLQDTLSGLRRHPDEELSRQAKKFAITSLHRALVALEFAPDREQLRSAADKDVVEAVDKMMEG